jgi:hypothetical protein
MQEIKNQHTFHVPVMGIGFTIDTPVKVAHYGISSVMSLVDDILVEKMREFYSKKLDLPYSPITEKNSSDHRAERITAYLNMVDEIVHNKFAELKRSIHDTGEEVQKYIDMLPDFSDVKKQFQEMIAKNTGNPRAIPIFWFFVSSTESNCILLHFLNILNSRVNQFFNNRAGRNVSLISNSSHDVILFIGEVDGHNVCHVYSMYLTYYLRVAIVI